MSQAACSNNSTDVLKYQSQTEVKINPNYKVAITFFVLNRFGELIHEKKCQLSPSYFRRGIKKWFWDHGVSDYELKPEGRPNHVIAVGVY